MRYTLWSHETLVGHTDLDIPTITPTMRQGFIEPTEAGMPALRDATGVNRVINENLHRRRLRGTAEWADEDFKSFRAACDRREALDFVLRDERGQPFDCEFMRVWDLRDLETDQTREDREWEYEYELSRMTPEERAEFDAEMQENEELVEEILEERDEEAMYHSAWPPPPEPDVRWETMQYHLQVHLKGCFDHAEDEAVDLM